MITFDDVREEKKKTPWNQYLFSTLLQVLKKIGEVAKSEISKFEVTKFELIFELILR